MEEQSGMPLSNIHKLIRPIAKAHSMSLQAFTIRGGICYVFRHLKVMTFHVSIVLDLCHELRLINIPSVVL
jgi:hypothetical protein